MAGERFGVGPAVTGLFEFLAWVAVAATIGGFAGAWWWVLDGLANFRVQLAVVLIVLAGALVMLGRRRTAIVVVAGAVLNAALVVPIYVGAPPRAAGATLEVLHFNVQLGNQRQDEVIEYLRGSGADVIFLSEVNDVWRAWLQAAALPYRIGGPRPGDSLIGVTALTRVDGAATVEAVSGLGTVVTTAIGERQVRLLGIHPVSPTSAARTDLRDSTLRAAGRWIGEQQGPVAVVGDFNATSWTAGFRSLMRGNDLIDSRQGIGLQPSWPVDFWPIALPIDHLLHTRDLITVDRRLGPDLGSDHRPVHVTLSLGG